MSDKSRNEGVRIIAQFDDRAVPIGGVPSPDAGPSAPGGIEERISRLETALRTIHAELAEIKQLQAKAG